MKNVYSVRLSSAVSMEPAVAHFSGKTTTHLYVVASSFASAIEAVQKKHSGAEVRGVDLMNYAGVPIVVGE